MWPGGVSEPRPTAMTGEKDITVLGADIIAELRKSQPPPPPGPPSLMQGNNKPPGIPEAMPMQGLPEVPPFGAVPPPHLIPPPPQPLPGPPPEMPPQQLTPTGPPDKGEWNPRLGPPPRRLSGPPGGGPPPDFGNWPPENRPPDFHHNQSPFSWQRSSYGRERRPSYDEERQFRPPHEFPPPPQNPYVYRRPDNEPRDPRVADPRRGAQPPPRPDNAGPPQDPPPSRPLGGRYGQPPPTGPPDLAPPGIRPPNLMEQHIR